MLRFVVILLVGLVLEAVGVVLLSRGLKDIGELQGVTVAEVVRVAKSGLTHPKILLGVALEAAFFGILLFLLSRADVSLVWPLTSLGFVITALAAKFYLHEHVSGLRWAGVALIVLGAALVSWSERAKAPPPPALAPALRPPFAPEGRPVATVDLALTIARRFRVGYYDAPILAAAPLAGCGTVYSEDLASRQDYGGTRVVDPFAAFGSDGAEPSNPR